MSQYDCEHPPADAVTQVPGGLGRISKLVCMPAGPAIVAGEGWSWRYTGSFFDLPQIPGYAHVDSMGLMPPFYFTKLSARDLDDGEAARLSDELAGQVETYRPKTAPVQMSILEATNNYAKNITVYTAMESADNGWVLVCTPECRPNYVIIVEKRKRN
ncbi:MAG: hypothetical protein PVH25_04040 [Burkholderiales bacterium]|jgi:hypothetical protein